MGICSALFIGMRFSNLGAKTLLDELLLITAFLMFVSVFMSYLDIRAGERKTSFEDWADSVFMVGLFLLMASLLLLWINLL